MEEKKVDIEAKIFQRKRPDFSKFKTYGLLETQNGYHYETNFMNEDFRAIINIDNSGFVSGIVIDKMNNEEYMPLRVPSQNGAYVCSVRNAYEDILTNIAQTCYEDILFASDQANRITKQIYDKYGDQPDFPWKQKSYQTAATFRHANTSKWYGLIMNIKKDKLDKSAHDLEVDILNLKINENDRENLHKEDGIYPAYHMNHKYWISILLDETLSDERIMKLIDISYQLTDKKDKKKLGK